MFLHKHPASGIGTNAVIARPKYLFAEHQIPNILHTDNGPQHASSAFADFTRVWHFEHVTRHPHYPSFNGFADSMVNIVKTALTKTKYSSEGPPIGLPGTPINTSQCPHTITFKTLVLMPTEVNYPSNVIELQIPMLRPTETD